MSFSYRHLTSFVTVARFGTITRAAEVLNVSQPALTQTIRALEDLVEIPLFDRNAKGVSLTRAGAEFIPIARRLISEMDDALGDLRGFAQIRRGRVAVAGLPSLTCRFLPSVVARFSRSYPNLHTIIYDGLTSSVEEKVLRGECDFGLTCPLGEHGKLYKEHVGDDDLELICHKQHPLATVERVTWRMICDYKFIGLSHQSSTRTFVDRAFASVGRVVDPSYEVGHITTVGGIVAEGLGVTVVPRMTRVLINQPNIIFRRIEEPVVGRQIYLIRQPDRSLSPAAQLLWDMIREESVTTVV
ncbi:MAG: LysR family transcriptional regulator [Rhodospirillum sp.]|nr:LysR family transcriptional regulator [Rhodospirillum sp.]MCF8491291.1 LysR family transcriptional regulator [Rhodospirillum sp.]MCF8501011.1 LysR family transcriptional regulator [Rhodospirillum sp.]